MVGGALSTTGASLPTSITRPGHNSRFSFTGAVGQQLSLGLTATTFDGLYYVAVTRPDGTTLVNTPLAGVSAELDLPTLTQAGTYQVIIDPMNAGTGDATVTLSTEVEGGTLAPGEPGRTAVIERPGQNARLLFTAAVGQRPTLNLTGVTLNGLYTVTFLRPDGTILTSRTLIGDGTATLPTLTTAGTYQIVIDPSGAATGSLTVALAAA